MRRNLYTTIMLFCFFHIGSAQNWQSLNGGTDWNVADLFADTVSGQLFISGAFQHAGDIEANGVAVWDGSQFQTFGTGVDNCITTCPIVLSTAVWNDEVYCSPTSYSMGGVLDPNGLMKWDGEEWARVKNGLTSFSGNGGAAMDFIPFNNALYILGAFQVAGTDTAYSIASWDGEELSSLGFPYANPEVGIVGRVQSGVFKDDVLYVGGNFRKELGIENTIDFAWYENGNWYHPEQSIIGGNDDISKVIVYKDEIYVGGNFRVSSGNTGNAIMRFQDGIFVDVGGSFDSELANIRDMVVFDGKLFVFGLFDSVGGGIPAQNIASWDGEKWCGYGFDFDHLIRTAEVLGDQLFIGGPFDSINYQPYNHLAFWEGELEPIVCGNPVSIAPEEQIAAMQLTLFPNPTTSTLHIQLQHAQSTQGKLQIENLTGQTLHAETLNLSPALQSWQVDVADWPSGVYVVRLLAGAKQVVRKFVKE
ncbi:MAG: T9SS type A sorting domain-containing protein [Phaeodactylibacter sp.]|nr:T9SS type A sorting domain-containing protein [Phaeodactylibacter sp.]